MVNLHNFEKALGRRAVRHGLLLMVSRVVAIQIVEWQMPFEPGLSGATSGGLDRGDMLGFRDLRLTGRWLYCAVVFLMAGGVAAGTVCWNPRHY